MYGVIIHFLREYVIECHGGEPTWQKIIEAQGHKFKLYFPVQDYPDEEVLQLVGTASDALNIPIPDILEDFGAYIGPKLLTFYHMYLKDKSMKTFDVIEAAGARIHDVLHEHNPNRKPPMLTTHRKSDNVLYIHYQSHRKLCPIVSGIIRGLGDNFNEQLEINETQCMHDGDDRCIMRVTKSIN